MEKLFDFTQFTTNERLFHFLADTNASGIEILTPHLTDEAKPVGAGTGNGNVSQSTTTDPFLKNLFAENKEKKDGDLLFQSLIKSEEKMWRRKNRSWENFQKSIRASSLIESSISKNSFLMRKSQWRV